MLKFTISAKKLKTMIEKGLIAVNKKTSLASLHKLYLQVEADETVKILGTDMEHFVEMRTHSAWNTSPGVIGIDINDIKIISKMNGDVTIEDISTEEQQKINVKCGKKIVTIPCVANTDIFLPSMDETEEHIFTVEENWLLATIVNLSLFTLGIDTENKMLNMFHFNIKQKRVEACDGHRIGMRTINNQQIVTKSENPFDNIKLHIKCLSVFKKVMDKKSDAEVKIYQDKKFIKIEGKNFTYITRRVDELYLNLETILTNSSEFAFDADRKKMLELMQYNAEMAKNEKKPTIFHSENGKLYSFVKTSRYEIFDEIEVDNLTMNEDLFIGFNSHYLVDALSIIDTDKPMFRGEHNKAPMYIDGNEYNFMILPVYIDNDKDVTGFKKFLGKVV